MPPSAKCRRKSLPELMSAADGLSKEAVQEKLNVTISQKRELKEEAAVGDTGGYYPPSWYLNNGYDETAVANIVSKCPKRVCHVVGDTYKLDIHKTKN